MNTQTSDQLVTKKCAPCEGGVDAYPRADALAQLEKLPDWHLTADGRRIRREWVVKNFMVAMKFFNRVAELAEEDGHHPDLHLTGYRNVAIGNSYIQTVTWDEGACPLAYGLLATSQSTDPENPFYADQTRLYSQLGTQQQWPRLPFCAADIDAMQVGQALHLEVDAGR